MRGRKNVEASIRGCIESVDDSIIRGWAVDPSRADEALALEVLVDGERVAEVLADLARPDLHAAGVTGVSCGFAVDISEALGDGADHLVSIRCGRDSVPLAGSPIKVRTAVGADPDVVSNLDPIEWSVRGWAYRLSEPEAPLVIDVSIDGRHFSEVRCESPRPDLEPTEHPSSCGFDLALPESIADGFSHFVDVRVRESRRRIAGAPATVKHRLIRSPIRPGSLALDTVIAEFGDRSTLEQLVGESGRLALLATHRPSPVPSEDVARLSRALADAGFPVVVIDTSEQPLLPAGPVVEPGRHADESVSYTIHRRNSGWDFGSWFAALGSLEDVLSSASELLLVNDSNHGPFGDLGPMIDRGRALGADLWGCTESFVGSHHLQSYFLGIRLGDAARQHLMAFARGFDFPIKKAEIISKGEIGLSTHFREAGLRVAAIHPYGDLVDAFLSDAQPRCDRVAALPGVGGSSEVATSLQELLDDVRLRRPRNPTLDFWDVLIARGHPFLKRQLLDSNPTGVANLDEVADRLGIDLEAVNRERSLRGMMPVY